MTKPKLEFSPYSQEYFDDPYEIYRRMRDETPIYYDEEEDFYALTRHADVAAALKDHESFSSTRGCHLSMIKSGQGFQKSIIFMDPPGSPLHAQPAQQGVHPSGDPVPARHRRRPRRALPVPGRSRRTSTWCRTSPARSPSRSSRGWPGVPEDFRQQVRHWIDKGLEVKPGQLDLSDENMQANIDAGVYYYGLVQERRENPQDDMISRLIAAEIPGEDGEMRRLDDVEITGFVALLGGAGAETVTKLVGSAVVEFARHPEQWQMLLDDRSLVPAAVEELLRYVGPVQYNVRYTLKETEVPSGTIPAHKPVFLMKAAANRDPRAFDDGEDIRHHP